MDSIGVYACSYIVYTMSYVVYLKGDIVKGEQRGEEEELMVLNPEDPSEEAWYDIIVYYIIVIHNIT